MNSNEGNKANQDQGRVTLNAAVILQRKKVLTGWQLCVGNAESYARAQFVWEKRREILRGEGGRLSPYFTMGG
jgi:hypothetical protein